MEGKGWLCSLKPNCGWLRVWSGQVGTLLHTPQATGNLSGVRKRSLLVSQPPGAEKHWVECREREENGKAFEEKASDFSLPLEWRV